MFLPQATKAHVKLNTKKLYSADGYAVKELLKIASLLYTAMRANAADRDPNNADIAPKSFELSNKATDLKACRQLASQITAKGAKLYELLGKEVELRDLRRMAISRPVDVDELEKGVRQSIDTVHVRIPLPTLC